MTRYGQIGWRIVAVAAFVGTAVLAVVLTRAPIRAGAALSSEITGPACPTSGPEELQVTLPHQGRSAFVAVRIPVCSEKGRASLSVQAIQARPGVPGYPIMP